MVASTTPAQWACRLSIRRRVPDSLATELVGHRADIVAGRWQVESAAAQIKVAKAQFYPNLNLLAIAGVGGLNINRLPNSNSITGGWGPTVSLPVCNGVLMRGNLRVRTDSSDIAVESYNGTVNGALQEVADRVTSFRSHQKQLERTDEALASALRTYELAEPRLSRRPRRLSGRAQRPGRAASRAAAARLDRGRAILGSRRTHESPGRGCREGAR
jgi:outer membrane protein TolC